MEQTVVNTQKESNDKKVGFCHNRLTTSSVMARKQPASWGNGERLYKWTLHQSNGGWITNELFSLSAKFKLSDLIEAQPGSSKQESLWPSNQKCHFHACIKMTKVMHTILMSPSFTHTHFLSVKLKFCDYALVNSYWWNNFLLLWGNVYWSGNNQQIQ